MAEDYTVQEGDCISSIAYDHGLFWETLWNDSANAALKAKRKDPDTLKRGDQVHIPDLTVKEEAGATEARHAFKLKGVPVKLVLVLRRISKKDEGRAAEPSDCDAWDFKEPKPEPLPDEPDANAPYILYVDGVQRAKGETDSDGRLEVKLSPKAGNGTLVVHRNTAKERTIDLNFRHMDPADELSGICKRLVNLGFCCPTDVEDLTPEVSDALTAFQRRFELRVTGQPDEGTRNKLQDLHGG